MEKGKLPTGVRKINIRAPFVPILDALAEEEVTDPTELVNRAVREFLERLGRWPAKRAVEAA